MKSAGCEYAQCLLYQQLDREEEIRMSFWKKVEQKAQYPSAIAFLGPIGMGKSFKGVYIFF